MAIHSARFSARTSSATTILPPSILVMLSKSLKPCLFIEAVDRPEMIDENNRSWMNLTSASVNVSLVEALVLGGIPANQIGVITHYTAQQKVYRHAFAQLAAENPTFDFGVIITHSTDTIQGGAIDIAFLDPVRTASPGFTNSPGRNSVLLTRARTFFVCTGYTNFLKLASNGTPWMTAAFNYAKINRVCIRISKAKQELQYLLTHPHVHHCLETN
jgi:hypothetical protein